MGEDKAFVTFQRQHPARVDPRPAGPSLRAHLRRGSRARAVPGSGAGGGQGRPPGVGFGGGHLHGGAGLAHRAGGVRGLRHALCDPQTGAAAGGAVGGLRRVRAPARRAVGAAVRGVRQGGPGRYRELHPGGRPADPGRLRGAEHRLPGHGRPALWATPSACSRTPTPRPSWRQLASRWSPETRAGGRRCSLASGPSWT